MKLTRLLALCVLMMSTPAFAQIIAPYALYGDLDSQTGIVDLSWVHLNADYFEDFEDGIPNGWQADINANWGVSNGRLYTDWTPTVVNYWSSAFYSSQTFSNGLYEVSVRRTMGTDSYASSIFIQADGYYDENNVTWNGYLISIVPWSDGGGHFAVVEIIDGMENWITADWTYFANMNLGLDVDNVISVEANAGEYALFINGEEAYTWSSTSFATGFLAIGAAEDGENGIHGRVEWDYAGVDAYAAAVADRPAPVSEPIVFTSSEYLTHPPAHLARRVPAGYTPPRSMLTSWQSGELDDFVEYRVYRNGSLIGSTTSRSLNDQLPSTGPYNYTVTAYYDEGESDPAGPLLITWENPANLLLNEDFAEGLPFDWTVESYSGDGWFWDVAGDPGILPTPYMAVDSDGQGPDVTVQTRLIAPPLDISGVDFIEITFDHYFEVFESELAHFEYSVDGGATWVNVQTWDADLLQPTTDSFDLSDELSGETEVLFSWYYDDTGSWGWYWGIDNVSVYAQSSFQPVTITLTPQNTTIPAGGGTLTYDVHLVSNIGLQMPGLRYWTMVTLPSGQEYGPLMNVGWTLTPYMDATVNGLTQEVPAYAPAGNYLFSGHAGVYNNPNMQVHSGFVFTKEGTVPGDNFVFNQEKWSAGGGFLPGEVTGEPAVLPLEFKIGAARPNPFNPTTSVDVQLPEASDITVTVFNVMGQQVMELVAGRLSAGTHVLTLDGHTLSSGIYFIKAAVSGQSHEIQKVTLMK